MRPSETSLLLRTLDLGAATAIDPGKWTTARLAAMLPAVRNEGAELWLYRRLEALRLLEDEALARLIQPQARELTIRWMRVDEITDAVIRTFSDLNVPFALIKGPARRAAATLYPYADAKSSSDVDVLVPEEVAEAAWEALRRAGYEVAANREGPRTHPLHFHLPPIWDDRRVAVEIHFSSDRWVPPSEAWRRATSEADPVTWWDHHLRIPCATELLWHGLTHAFKAGPAAGYRLRAFLDAASILASRRTIHWDVLRERIREGEVREQRWGEPSPVIPAPVVHRWLGAAAQLAGVELPDDLRAAGSVSLRYLVQWRGALDGLAAARLQRRLLVEGIRYEAGLAATPGPGGTNGRGRARERVATEAARLAYAAWRRISGPP